MATQLDYLNQVTDFVWHSEQLAEQVASQQVRVLCDESKKALAEKLGVHIEDLQYSLEETYTLDAQACFRAHWELFPPGYTGDQQEVRQYMIDE